MPEVLTSTILDEILARTRQDVAEARRRLPLPDLYAQCRTMPACRDFPGALQGVGIAAIAEFKKASPSAGKIRPGAEPEAIAREYAAAGAACLSVLTEPHYFSGSPDDLRLARGAVDLPVLRKDFIVEPYQVCETRAMGADAMLLIACCLERDTLAELLNLGGELGLTVLVEVHDETDLQKIEGLPVALVGVNNRDLKRMETDLETSLRLRPALPEGVVTVSESGIKSREDVRRLEAAAFDAILAGEGLMKADNPGEHLRLLLQE
jgi:indole-3-glycerol phosphate synthase